MKCVKRKIDAGSMWVQCVVDVGSIRVVVGVEEKILKKLGGGGRRGKV